MATLWGALVILWDCLAVVMLACIIGTIAYVVYGHEAFTRACGLAARAFRHPGEYVVAPVRGLLKFTASACGVGLYIALVLGVLYGIVWVLHAMWRAT